MPKDYKNIKKPADKNSFSLRIQGFLNFLTGLVIGLFFAFVVYLKEHDSTNGKHIASPEIHVDEISKTPEIAVDEITEDAPKPEYDFYQILPNMEVNVSEWVAEEGNSSNVTANEKQTGVYILQVGSFEEFQAADETKAKLALLGIDADIQRVVINGRDIRHRVRIGPYNELDRVNEIRETLIDNQLDFMLLKLKVEDI